MTSTRAVLHSDLQDHIYDLLSATSHIDSTVESISGNFTVGFLPDRSIFVHLHLDEFGSDQSDLIPFYLCYECESPCHYLFDDSRCSRCTRLTPEEVAGTNF